MTYLSELIQAERARRVLSRAQLKACLKVLPGGKLNKQGAKEKENAADSRK